MEEVYLMNRYVKKWKSKTKQSTTEVERSQFAAKLSKENTEVPVDKNREINEPTLVLSVIGDSNTLVPNQWPKSVFQEALIETAKCEKETWILFRGCNGGVSNVVKEAYEDYDSMECWITRKEESESDRKRSIKLINTTNKEGDNFLLNAEMPFQNMKDDPSFLRFETFVSQQNISYFGPDMIFEIPVPTAIIVCEGDIQTISHISEALEKQLPVIIMKGSGKAADLVLDYLNKCKENVIQEKFRLLFGYKFDEEEYKKMKKHLKCIKQNKELVGVFDLYNDHPLQLSGIVGEAVVRILSMKIEQIHLADASQSGDHINVHGLPLATKAYVMNPRFSTPTSLPLYFSLGYTALQENEEFRKKCGKVLLLEALKANRCEYVSSLMDQGVDIKSIDLPDLYKWQSKKEKQLVKHFFEMNFKKIIDNAEKGNILFVVAVRNACRIFLKYEEFKDSNTNESNSDIGINDVLLWAVIFNRRELAELYWLRGNDQLWTGLICSDILKRLSDKIRDRRDNVFADALEEHSKIFKERCTSILDKLSEDNTDLAYKLLCNCTSVWGIRSNPLNFAYENSVYEVVAHKCVRKILELKMNTTSMFCGERTMLLSPRVFYYYNVIYTALMLLIYSWFVLTSTNTEYNVEESMQAMEYLVYLWRFGDFIEECLQCIKLLRDRNRSHLRLTSLLVNYFSNFWNLLDWLSQITLTVAICSREFLQSEGQIYARNMFALSLLFMYLRFLETFLITEKTGTIVIMIIEMLKDLWRFIVIIMCVVLGFGMYYHANLWPDHQSLWSGSLSNWRIWTIMSHTYWQLFGEVDLEFLTGSNQDNCSNNRSIWEADPSTERCPQQDWSVPVIAGIYMMFTNLLLVNIVIAKFSNTFERINKDSEQMWTFFSNFYMYKVLNDYSFGVPSPFNLLILLFHYMTTCKNPKIDAADNTEMKRYHHILQKHAAFEQYWKSAAMATTVDSKLKQLISAYNRREYKSQN